MAISGLSLQSKSLNQDSGVLFSPPSIVKNTLADMMHEGDADGSQEDSNSVQVQPATQYYFTHMPFSQPQQQQLRVNNHPAANILLSASTSSHQMHPEAQRQFHVAPSQSHVVYNSHNLQMSVNNHSSLLMGRQGLVSHHPHQQQQQSHLQQQGSQNAMPSTTPAMDHRLVVMGGDGGNSRGGNAGQGAQGNFGGMRSMSGVNTFQSNKENLPGEEVFLMLRNDDDDLDLGQFQLSKSIYNQQQYKPPQNAPQNHSILGNSNPGSHKALPPFGSVISTSASSSAVGGYFGFDRTNLINQTGASRPSPLKYQNNHMGGFVKVEDVYIDSNSQASLPTTVSSPASTISYFDGQVVQEERNRVSTGPVMDFQHFDLNDDYWLEFGQ